MGILGILLIDLPRLIVAIFTGILFAFFEIKKMKKWLIPLFFTFLNFIFFWYAITIGSDYLWLISGPFTGPLISGIEVPSIKYFYYEVEISSKVFPRIILGMVGYYTLLTIISSKFQLKEVSIKEIIRKKWIIIFLHFVVLSSPL